MDFSQQPRIQNLNTPPDSDEIEISLLGSGFGECVVIHTGNGEWTIVDSCKFKGIEQPAALHYFDQIGLDYKNNVKLIVATHWDDDHIRGIGEVVTKCSSAKFAMSAAISCKKFLKIVVDSPLSQAIKLGQTVSTGVNEFNTIFHHLQGGGKNPNYALNNTTLLKSKINHDVDIIALSPHSTVFEKAIESIISLIPVDGKPVGSIKAPKPNFTSVVLWLKIGDERILLGADMEEKPEYKGWTLLLKDKMMIDRRARVYKVAHHGSSTGDHDDIWSELLGDNPLCMISPWMLAGRVLPSDSDLVRISKRTDSLYLSHRTTAPQTFKSKEKHVKRAMNKIKAKQLLHDFRMVRLRKKAKEPNWSCECFGSAVKR